jgi:D-alanine-D-alanine ligase
VSRLRVAVLSGGRSSEHDISVASARSVVEGLRGAGYDAVPIEITREGRWALARATQAALETTGEGRREPPAGQPGRPGSGSPPIPVTGTDIAPFGTVDVVFPVLHGPFGEDGTVQGLLELADVAYVGPGVAASAVAMDKDLFKAVMRANGIPVTRSVTVLARNRGRIENPFRLPVVVKPARLGSSVGISVARTPTELEAALDLAFHHDEKVLIEEYVSGVEVECSVLGNQEPFASVVGEIVPLKADWYDFASKYEEGGMDLVVPARITAEQTARAQELSVRSFVACDCEGMARVDMFVREDGEVLVNELNTIPGFTATSVYAKLMEASGTSYAELLRRLVELALERHERRARLRY